MATPPPGIEYVPPPWDLKGTLYTFFFWIPASQTANFPSEIAYSPLERVSHFAATAHSGSPRGGLATVMVYRYASSPVGPYDEFILMAGSHSYVTEKDGKRVEKKNARITRIYVSTASSCWHGRRDWNTPKHLARFEFNDLPNNSTEIKIFPHDTAGDPTEASPSVEPFFKAVYTPLRFVPQLPFSTAIGKYVGVDFTLVQPPVPEGKGSQGELCGSERWCGFYPTISSARTSVGWFDVRQDVDGAGAGESEGEGGGGGGVEKHFWPGWGRWILGVKMEAADVKFSKMEYWDAPRSVQ